MSSRSPGSRPRAADTVWRLAATDLSVDRMDRKGPPARIPPDVGTPGCPVGAYTSASSLTRLGYPLIKGLSARGPNGR